MKITTDDVGISVSWKPAPPGRLRRLTRRMLAADVMLCLLLAIWATWLAIRLDWTIGFVALLFTGVPVVALLGHRKLQPPPVDRPKPDYALIASAERETEGRTFHHADAPCRCDECARQSGSGGWSVIERNTVAAACEKLDHLAKQRAVAAARTKTFAAGRDLCDQRGYHIYAMTSTGCIVCRKAD